MGDRYSVFITEDSLYPEDDLNLDVDDFYSESLYSALTRVLKLCSDKNTSEILEQASDLVQDSPSSETLDLNVYEQGQTFQVFYGDKPMHIVAARDSQDGDFLEVLLTEGEYISVFSALGNSVEVGYVAIFIQNMTVI